MGSGGSKGASESEVEARCDAARNQESAQFFQRMAEMQACHAQEQAQAAERSQANQARMYEKMADMQSENTNRMMSLLEQQRQADKERDERYLAYMAQNRGKEEELEKANQELQAQLDKAEDQFIENAGDPEKYELQQVEIFQKFCDKIAEIPDPPKTQKPSVAVLGQNGVGKSSLINALVGKEVTPVGIIDTTKEICKCYESETTEYYDVPGCSEERAYTNLRSIMAIKEMHFIMIVYVDRIEHIVKLERMVVACKVPYVVVRNKIDQVKEDEARKEGYESRAKYLEAAYAKEKGKLKGNLIYVSANTKEQVHELAQTPQTMGTKVNMGGA